MDLVTLRPAADKIELRSSVELTDSIRVAALDRIARLVQNDDAIKRIFVNLEYDPEAEDAFRFIAKGELHLGGPDLLASVSSHDPLKSIDYLLDNFDRQLRRRLKNDGLTALTARIPRKQHR